jgi:hypothetical protein
MKVLVFAVQVQFADPVSVYSFCPTPRNILLGALLSLSALSVYPAVALVIDCSSRATYFGLDTERILS